jgi:acetylglutamate kinase
MPAQHSKISGAGGKAGNIQYKRPFGEIMSNVTVIKFGGSLGQNIKALAAFCKDVAKLAKKEPVVLVHGGGPEINSWVERLGLKVKFVNGRRFTDEATLEVVEMVLSGKVNKGFVTMLNKNGVKAVGISAKDGKTAVCTRVKELGLVGEPVKIDVALINTLLKAGFLPVLSSVGADAKGSVLNVNADSLAMALAGALKARRLILMTDVCGVLDAKKCTIPAIRVAQVDNLIKDSTVTGGMIPKLQACARAVKNGIKEVVIADGSRGLKAIKGTVIKK